MEANVFSPKLFVTSYKTTNYGNPDVCNLKLILILHHFRTEYLDIIIFKMQSSGKETLHFQVDIILETVRFPCRTLCLNVFMGLIFKVSIRFL
jgi:hypothetical protein